MASHSSIAEQTAPRLYLVTAPTADPRMLSRSLAAVLGTADVAAVLVSPTGGDERMLINALKELAPSVQGAGAALLLDGRPELVARAGADGAHLAGIAPFEAALASLKPDRIAGCGGLTSRHDAMTAAEAGADYVMFGEPDAQGRRPAFEAIRERVGWWAEVFEVPCVGFAGTLDEIAPLVAAGADFIATGMMFKAGGDPAAVTAEIMRRLATETVA